MVPRTPDDDTRESASWLVNLIQVMAVNEPVAFRAVIRAVRHIVDEHRRQTIAERLTHLDSQGLEEVDAFLNVIERNHLGDPATHS